MWTNTINMFLSRLNVTCAEKAFTRLIAMRVNQLMLCCLQNGTQQTTNLRTSTCNFLFIHMKVYIPVTLAMLPERNDNAKSKNRKVPTEG